MKTQKVESCEFVAGLCSSCGASDKLGCDGWVAPADRVQSLADQVESLTKERDALAANHKECVRCLGEALQDATNLAVERDALMSAAKLALETLVDFAEWEATDDPQRPATEAIETLRQAGVQ